MVLKRKSPVEAPPVQHHAHAGEHHDLAEELVEIEQPVALDGL